MHVAGVPYALTDDACCCTLVINKKVYTVQHQMSPRSNPRTLKQIFVSLKCQVKQGQELLLM